MQRESGDVWKKNILEDLEAELLKYETVGEFLTDIRKEFRGEDKESTKVVELMSGLKMIDFKFHFIFFSIFILFLIYFHFLFLEL